MLFIATKSVVTGLVAIYIVHMVLCKILKAYESEIFKFQ